MANRPDWLTARPVAHRGLHDASAGILENSLSAIRAAVAGNFAIEVDVQLSRDGEAMVFHDGNLRRMTGHDVPIDDVISTDLARMSLAGTADAIPTLWDVLQTIQGRVPIFIEIKNDDPIRPPAALLTRTLEVVGAYQGPVALMSFDPEVVKGIRRMAPKIPRGIIADKTTDPAHYGHLSAMERFRRRHLLHSAMTCPDFVAYCIKDLPAPGPATLRAFLNRPVLTWTVRSDQDRRSASTHADQMIFEGFNPGRS